MICIVVGRGPCACFCLGLPFGAAYKALLCTAQILQMSAVYILCVSSILCLNPVQWFPEWKSDLCNSVIIISTQLCLCHSLHHCENSP